MTKYLLFIVLLPATPSNAQTVLADSIIKKEALKESVRFLSHDSLRGRLTGAPGAETAAAFIAAKFKSIGLKPVSGNDEYFDYFTEKFYGKKITGTNVVAALPGKFTNDTLVIFSAHYDHIGAKNDMPTNGDYTYSDQIFNGANDNATGVSALIELARYFKAQDNNHYLLLFIAFAGEEMGMLGSGYLMKKTDPEVVRAVVNLEMLGSPETNNCFIISYRNSVIKNMLNSSLEKYIPAGKKKFFVSDPYPDEGLTQRSDHYPFAAKIKNAFTIMGSSPTDKYYHTIDDEYKTIDFNFLLKATKNIALAAEVFVR